MTDKELITLVKSLNASLMYCAPEAIEELLFDKLHPHIVGPTKRIKELEGRSKQQELSIVALAKQYKDREEALRAAQQCITDFLDVYGRGCSMLVLDEATKSLRNDALRLINRCLELAKPAASNRCQSTNHKRSHCYGDLWQCSECERWFCCNEGTDDGTELCDDCWAKKGE